MKKGLSGLSAASMHNDTYVDIPTKCVRLEAAWRFRSPPPLIEEKRRARPSQGRDVPCYYDYSVHNTNSHILMLTPTRESNVSTFFKRKAIQL